MNVCQIGGSGDEVGHGIAIDKDDHVWTPGSFSGSIDIDEDGKDDLINTSEADSYIVKFGNKGDLVKAEDIDASHVDSGRCIRTDSSGNAWAIGGFVGSIDIDGDGTDDLTSAARDGRLHLDKYISKG